MRVTIYHNPKCGTSRNALEFIENSGAEVEVILYLETPPTREKLVDLIGKMGISPRALLREKGTPFEELGLSDESLDDDALIDAMMAREDSNSRPLDS